MFSRMNERSEANSSNSLAHRRGISTSEASQRQTNFSTDKTMLGFKALEKICLSDPRNIIQKINERKNDFLDRINIDIERKDYNMFVLLVEILSKVCQSSFHQEKCTLLFDVIKSSFLTNLSNYINNLPNTEAKYKAGNKFYWDKQNQFWFNFITFFEYILKIDSSTTLQKGQPLLESICSTEFYSKLQTYHGLILSDDNQSRLRNLQERIIIEQTKSRSRNAYEEKMHKNYQQSNLTPRCDYQQGQYQNRFPAFDQRENVAHNKEIKSNEANRQTDPITGKRMIGFKVLEGISLCDPKDIIYKINERKSDFLNRVDNVIERKDYNMFVLIIKVLSKLCQSPLDDEKRMLLSDVVKSSFLTNLSEYIKNLSNTDTKLKAGNRFYWDNQNQFWHNFVTFFEYIINMNPSETLQKGQSIIESVCSTAFNLELQTQHGFILSDENQRRLAKLQERIIIEQKKLCNHITAGTSAVAENRQPKHFRELSVVPTRDDLLGQKPYVPANLVRGGYWDIDHYAGLQFRLLRADCFEPIRTGLCQYKYDSKRQKYDNIRVYHKVRFEGPYVNKNRIGVIVQLEENSVRRLQRVKWSCSKLFSLGSLLLFTNDACESFIAATILERDAKYLAEGRIPISIIENADASIYRQLKSDAEYVMIETDVYFEPYHQILKALQDPLFLRNSTMSKYIVNVKPEVASPNYVTNLTSYKVKTKGLEREFKVLQPHTWPSGEELGLDESQYEAYKLALTHEFSIIKGPSGTGKTFLGIQIAQTLLENIPNDNKRLILILCHTNRTLDQFLEHLNKVTKSIVQIEESRNPAMQDISLNKLRQSNDTEEFRSKSDERQNLKNILAKLRSAQICIQAMRDGVISYESIKKYFPEVNVLQQYYSIENGDILSEWLFQNMPYKDIDQYLIENKNEDEEVSYSDDETENNLKSDVVFDDPCDNDKVDDEVKLNDIEIKTSFLLDDASQKLKLLIPNYRSCETSNQEMETSRITIRDLISRTLFFKEMRNRFKSNGVLREIREGENLTQLTDMDKWSLYFTWANRIISRITEEIKPLQEKLKSAVTAYEQASMNLDLKLIQGKKVVGLTTGGAIKWRKLLQALAPSIVIVEQAAEVLEQYIVTSLTSNCQHLILIGDHQQLQPTVRVAQHYNLQVSLFERMVLNGMHSRRLGVQHRMRPEIAALIAPHIYRDLTNHPSVNAFPHVRGVTTDLFFFTHNYKEEEMTVGTSRTNCKEANMTLSLANYIMQQGYQPEDLTVLAAYTGQMYYMKTQRSKYPFLAKVKITVVDDYQGEESKIILLSLVRNNAQNNIGFLGTENRICVALSRAKEGFFIFGNIETLTAKPNLWTNIAKTLKDLSSIGAELRLKCENHPNTISLIMSPADFKKVPEGGCVMRCDYKFPKCGHSCPRLCHGYDRGHIGLKCETKCTRVVCELGHVCALKCFEKCQPCRPVLTKKLQCGHDKEYCHQEPDEATLCNTVVTVKLSQCGHEVKKRCHLDLDKLKKVICPVKCVYRVDKCGHRCERTCHVNDDPDHEQYVCRKPCAKAKKGCTADMVDRGDHQCPRMCYQECVDCNVEVAKTKSDCGHVQQVNCCEDVDTLPCRATCGRIMTCGHPCSKKCSEPCGDCNQMVTKSVPGCRHMITVACKEEAKREMCQKPCERMLRCGHQCIKSCGEKCDENKCMEITNVKYDSQCGHKVQLPCSLSSQYARGFSDSELLMSYCTEPCNMTLKCEHACPGTCTRCHQGRLHAPCTQPCHVTLICGHQCEEPCNQLCPPCKKPCEVKCVHSQCSNICGVPCVPCQEECQRQCVHGRCNRRCGEPCSREACDEACTRRLPCGHVCRGLCGEPCPDICRECRPDQFPKDFLGYDFDDDAKFIKLQDCCHVLEIEDAENLMKGDKETVMIRSCPFCRKPIINTYRYKDLVNKMYKAEFNPIKERVNGTKTQIAEKREKLALALSDFKKRHYEALHSTGNPDIIATYEELSRDEKKIFMMNLDMRFICINILDMIVNYYEQFKSAKLHEFEDSKEFSAQVTLVSSFLRMNINKLSQQQQEDIGREIKRMNSIIQLLKILSDGLYRSMKNNPNVKNVAKEAKSVVISNMIYDEDKAISALKKLEETVKLSGIVTKEERVLIVKAIGLKQGHWFKCPNGHFYCIGECGGAMEVGKCVECDAAIGGTRHTILPTNVLGSEMDGALHPAWSNAYNNMANYH